MIEGNTTGLQPVESGSLPLTSTIINMPTINFQFECFLFNNSFQWIMALHLFDWRLRGELGEGPTVYFWFGPLYFDMGWYKD